MFRINDFKIGDVVQIKEPLGGNIFEFDGEIIGFRDTAVELGCVFPLVVLAPNIPAYSAILFSNFLNDMFKITDFYKIKRLQHVITIIDLKSVVSITKQKW